MAAVSYIALVTLLISARLWRLYQSAHVPSIRSTPNNTGKHAAANTHDFTETRMEWTIQLSGDSWSVRAEDEADR